MELLGDVGRGCKRLRAEGDGCVGGDVSECETVGAGEDGEGSARDMRRGREARGKWEVKGLRERELHGDKNCRRGPWTEEQCVETTVRSERGTAGARNEGNTAGGKDELERESGMEKRRNGEMMGVWGADGMDKEGWRNDGYWGWMEWAKRDG